MSQQSAAPQAKAVVQDQPQAIHTKWATVAVFGIEHMATKDLELINAVLQSPEWDTIDHGVRIIVLRGDDYPIKWEDDEEAGTTTRKPVLAVASYDAHAIVINLNEHFRRAVKLAVLEPERSVYACYQHMFIQSLFHEMGHLSPRVSGDERRRMECDIIEEAIIKALLEEDDVEAFSLEAMFRLAKTTSLEPALWQSSTFFAEQLKDLITDAGLHGEDDDEWFRDQQWMLDNRVFYHLPASENNHPVTLNSFKGYLQLMDKDGGNDPMWEAGNTQEAATDAILGLMTHMGSETKPEPEMNGFTPPPAAPTEPAPEQQPEMHQPAAMATSTVDPMADDDEDMGVLGMYDLPEDTPETGSIGIPAHTQLTNVSGPNQHIAPTPPLWQQQNDQAVYSPLQDANGPSEHVAPAAKTLPVIDGMTPERTQQIIKTVYMKVYQHIFDRCQFSTVDGPERPFRWPEGATHEGIMLTPEERLVCFSMDCHDTAGRVCMDIPTTRGLVGRLNTQKNLPMYDLTLNFMGQKLRRRIAPQNAGKLKVWNQPASGYTAPALRAQQGHKIVHIFENDPTMKQHNKASGKSDWINKIEDGQFAS